MAKTEFTLDYPLVDENFNVLESANPFIENTSNEFENHHVTILVRDIEMIPTAMFLSMRKRNNVRFTVKLGDFQGANFVHSFLISGHIAEVICE